VQDPTTANATNHLIVLMIPRSCAIAPPGQQERFFRCPTGEDSHHACSPETHTGKKKKRFFLAMAMGATQGILSPMPKTVYPIKGL
jgi:hypothetical protein